MPTPAIYLLIPAAAANATVKRDHPFANEARYRHYNQDFANDDNSTIGGRTPCATLQKARQFRFAESFVAESQRFTTRTATVSPSQQEHNNLRAISQNGPI
jgi:hypothetical protein